MRIGVPREIKVHEYRVGLVPAGVRELALHGHQVLVESGAGNGIGVDDAEYRAAGAAIATRAPEIFERAELVVKVKEPQPHECEMLRPGQDGASRARCSSPTCIWRQTRLRPRA